MKHGSLFSGGGGFDLAAEAVGWTNVFHCERDEFCRRVLKFYWPDADAHTDIKELNGEQYRGKIDIITGGFPCQPFSVAGKRRGTEDDRYLWPEMHRVIKAIRPRWAVCENVYGLVNWNDGLVFDTVLSDLESEGYEVWPFVLPAAGVNAPHQRYRVWIVAHDPQHAAQQVQPSHPDAHGDGRGREHGTDEKHPGQRGQHAQHDAEQAGHHAADAVRQRLQRRTKPGEDEGTKGTEEKAPGRPARFNERSAWANWPAQSPLCGGDDGIPGGLDGIAFSGWRARSVKLYGNAIVPDVAIMVFRAIIEFELINSIT